MEKPIRNNISLEIFSICTRQYLKFQSNVYNKPPACWDADVLIETYELLLPFIIVSPCLYTNIPIIDSLNIKIVLILMISFLGKRLYFKQGS